MFYWEREVKEIKDNSIILDDGQEITLTKSEQEVVLSEESQDLWKFIHNKAMKLSWKILDLLEDYENIVKKSDMQFVLEYLVSSMKWNYDTAVAKALWVYNEDTVKKYWVSKVLEDVTFKELKKHL